MCSKSGADFGGRLIWCILVAAVVAWVMQEGAGRLTVSADAMRTLSPEGMPMLFRHLFALFCCVGNFAYECNNFAGTMAAVEIMLDPPRGDEVLLEQQQEEVLALAGEWANGTGLNCSMNGGSGGGGSDGDHTSLASAQTTLGDGSLAARQLINVLLGPLVVCLLLAGSTSRVSQVLSAIVAAMIACFAIALGGTGLPAHAASGIVPNIPIGGAELALSLMGTTSPPVNLMLGSSLAKEASAASMGQGIAIASALSGVISLLVLLVGAAVTHSPCGPSFQLRDVAKVLQRVMGDAGVWGFAIGLFGAGVSSAMTVPMGNVAALEELYDLRSRGGGGGGGDRSSGERLGCLRWRRRGRSIFLCAFICLALIPTLCDPPRPGHPRATIQIITVAQIVNGLLLPCVTCMLLFALNHAGVMSKAQPQSQRRNVAMVPCVAMTVYLAVVVLLKQSVGRMVDGGGGRGAHVAIMAAMPLTALITLGLCVAVQRARARVGSVHASGGRKLGADQGKAPARQGPHVEITLSEPLSEPTATSGVVLVE
jgi:manganese transport protein